MLKRKVARRRSAQYYISAEDHVENEVKHERLLTESSRLSSSWTGLSISCADSIDCSSSSSSAHNSPIYRPSSFSGPLVISVTCNNTNFNLGSKIFSIQNKPMPQNSNFSKSSSCHPSPVASPVSSRVQCYSPGLRSNTNSPNPRRHTTIGESSPLYNTLGRKRGYLACCLGAGGGSSSGDASREGSPDLLISHRSVKSIRQGDVKFSNNSDYSNCRWPPCLPTVQSPSSPSCHLFSSVADSTTPSSPSSCSLPSPRVSICSPRVSFSYSSQLTDNNVSLASNAALSETDKNLTDSNMNVELKSNISISCTSESNICIHPSGT